ncbi:uncharacterized protein MELLADRAFT_91346 [Melampsora larici-populina 98AG31]|uniref:Uncharacterized protein n=1 Tax=Melampsora larici-populina (strain 98AG31 / pathotype 3-4-7) TaxID=747676 RepID=F4RYQ7_MELLP|nr:uncharacterized protein MELLADRAFT_91346 [Melampsora larici-populina 98AG31]EGG02512.1 hypothetical protein MELLADRAFT_91346 [Melampsora larici-populina 98AG31]
MSRPTVAPPGLRSRAKQATSVEHRQTPLSPTIPEEGGVPGRFNNSGTGVPPGIMDLFDQDMDSSSDELESLYGPSHLNDVAFPDSRDGTEVSPEQDQRAITNTWLPWYPLRKKEHAALLLMLGTSRDLMSTAEYTRIRCILKNVLQVDLPDLGHLKNIRKDLKARLGLRVLEQTSPLGNPCFTLSVTDIISQELSNPEVAPNIEFLPEDDKAVIVDRYSQSKKWREDLPPSLRVPMVDVDGEHFYIYEPAQLADSRVVIPVFFYKDELVVWAKCLEVVPNGPGGSHHFRVAREPKFDSATLLDVDVQTFACSFTRIELHNGMKWCNSSATQLLRELVLHGHI